MTVKKKAVERDVVIPIPANLVGYNENAEIASANMRIYNRLKRSSVAEISYCGLPDEDCDVFRRRIRVSRIAKENAAPEAMEDIPDLTDMHFTNLPWAGHSTLNSSPRQFRSKNILAVVIDVVREIDGYLYGLYVDAGQDFTPHDPVLVTLVPAKKSNSEHLLFVNKSPSEDMVETLLKPDFNIPPSLIAEMAAIGYQVDELGFYLPERSGFAARIRCELYGKIVVAA